MVPSQIRFHCAMMGKKICTQLVAGRVKNILAQKAVESKLDQGPGSELIRNAQGLLDMIIDDVIILGDAPAASQPGAVASALTTGSASGFSRTFERGSTQW